MVVVAVISEVFVLGAAAAAAVGTFYIVQCPRMLAGS